MSQHRPVDCPVIALAKHRIPPRQAIYSINRNGVPKAGLYVDGLFETPERRGWMAPMVRRIRQFLVR